MFKRALFAVFMSLLIAALYACSDSGTGPDIPTVEYADYVFFDTTQNYLVKGDYASLSSQYEIYLWWEENFGEPFIDVNENGVYDVGIDIFIMGVGEDNMDLNHNGQYDGPDEPWEPGFPFDDIDGNGVCRNEGLYPDGTAGPNVPYFDGNGNGALDTDLMYKTLFIRPTILQVTDSNTVFDLRLLPFDSIVYYVSDSGVTYRPVPAFATSPISGGTLYTDSTGLYYWSNWSDLTFGGYQLYFQLLPTGNICNDTARIQFSVLDYDTPTYSRQILLDQSLELNGVSYTGLLKVRCDQIEWTYPGPEEEYEGAYWEFYFSEALGIAAIREKPKATEDLWQFSFEALDQPVPILLTK